MARVLIIGSGGREHALTWKFLQSSSVSQIFVAPGNAGIADIATLVPIDILDFKALADFVIKNNIDLTFVGPEAPLVSGIVDYFNKLNLKIFGPTAKASMLEGSKIFSKMMMKKYNIPTAKYESFDNYQEAYDYLIEQTAPIVIKADGLASGKGVIIAHTMEEAKNVLINVMHNNLFQKAGNRIIIEEHLEGREFSLLAFVNKDKVYPMQISQDYKRAFDDDRGFNTGGMGSYAPVTDLSNDIVDDAINHSMKVIAKAMLDEGTAFTGILYGGFMVTKDGVKTIEYNVRFGDPETEVLMINLKSDLYEVITNILDEKDVKLLWHNQVALGVVLASKGYPEEYKKGDIIKGIDEIDGIAFHMGTSAKDNDLTINGGRVLFIANYGDDIKTVRDKVYQDIKKIKCDTLFYRQDIAVVEDHE